MRAGEAGRDPRAPRANRRLLLNLPLPVRRGPSSRLHFLPSSSKPKPVCKSFSAAARCRSHLHDLLSPTSTFFALSLSLSFLFLLTVVIRYGVPNPLSPSQSKPHLILRPAFHKCIVFS